MKYQYYGPILIKYQDQNNEMFTIDNDFTLQRAIGEVLDELTAIRYSKKCPTLKVILQFKPAKSNRKLFLMNTN